MVFYCTALTFHKKAEQVLFNVLEKIRFITQQENAFPSIKEEIMQAHQEWLDAKEIFEVVEGDLIDYAVFRLNATERKYMYLLNEAKKNGVNAWHENINIRN